jgi:hypothetical protein
MPAPFDDWQFYVVTAIALVAAAIVARVVLPRRKTTSSREKKASLTIRGKKP